MRRLFALARRLWLLLLLLLRLSLLPLHRCAASPPQLAAEQLVERHEYLAVGRHGAGSYGPTRA
jgi:hypothetical protein